MKKFLVSRSESVVIVAESLEQASQFGNHLFERGYRDEEDESSSFGYSNRPETTELSVRFFDDKDLHA